MYFYIYIYYIYKYIYSSFYLSFAMKKTAGEEEIIFCGRTQKYYASPGDLQCVPLYFFFLSRARSPVVNCDVPREAARDRTLGMDARRSSSSRYVIKIRIVRNSTIIFTVITRARGLGVPSGLRSTRFRRLSSRSFPKD